MCALNEKPTALVHSLWPCRGARLRALEALWISRNFSRKFREFIETVFEEEEDFIHLMKRLSLGKGALVWSALERFGQTLVERSAAE